jgi:pimeloyl-ACP methyl ester carboxylesterase
MSETPEGEQTPPQQDQPRQQDQTADANQPNQTDNPTKNPTDAAVSSAQSPSQAVPPPPTPTPTPTPPARASTTAVATQRGIGRSIHYNLSYIVANEAAGPRGAIVLLHDLPGGAFVWDGVLLTLAATGHAVYAFDMLGYGQSDHPWPSDTSIWGHADSLLYAFQGLKLSEVTLVGIGQGAAVAQVLANRLFREGVARLALINSYAFETAFAPNWPLPDMAKRQDPEAPHHANIEDVLNDLRKTLPTGAVSKLASERIAAYVDEWKGNVGKQMLYQHIRLMNPNYINSVATDNAKLTVPVLLLWGEQDSVTPPALGERLRDEIPGAQFVTIPNAGHLLLEDAPGEVGRHLAEFAR